MWQRLLTLVVFSSGVIIASEAPPAPRVAQAGQTRPNILWITTEDNGPQYGIYGDS
jgi:hypothetical protein